MYLWWSLCTLFCLILSLSLWLLYLPITFVHPFGDVPLVEFMYLVLSPRCEQTQNKTLIDCCTLYLRACQLRVTVGDSGLCCCVCVTSFEPWLTPCVLFLFAHYFRTETSDSTASQSVLTPVCKRAFRCSLEDVSFPPKPGWPWFTTGQSCQRLRRFGNHLNPLVFPGQIVPNLCIDVMSRR